MVNTSALIFSAIALGVASALAAPVIRARENTILFARGNFCGRGYCLNSDSSDHLAPTHSTTVPPATDQEWLDRAASLSKQAGASSSNTNDAPAGGELAGHSHHSTSPPTIKAEVNVGKSSRPPKTPAEQRAEHDAAFSRAAHDYNSWFESSERERKQKQNCLSLALSKCRNKI